MPCGSAWLGPELEEILDFQAAAAEQPDHVAVAEVEFHRLIIWPFKPVHAEVGAGLPLHSSTAS
jgi:hypothetical protein